MKNFIFAALLGLGALLCDTSYAEPLRAPIDLDVTILCYHDVADDPDTAFPDTVTVKEFAEQLSWLGSQGYTVISMQQYLSAKAGLEKLPAKALMLTFDDGYLSFYKTVFPLLRTFGYPSTLAVIGEWASRKSEPGTQLMTPDGPGMLRSLKIMNEKQIREVASSGIVEVASHSFDLHKGVAANAFGSLIPSAITPIIQGDRYETESEYETRISQDLKHSRDWLTSVIGVAPRVMVWPYGRFNGTALRAARYQGFTLSLGLGEQATRDSVDVTPGRVYVTGGTRLSRFAENVRSANHSLARRHISLQVPEQAITPGKGIEATWFDGLISNVSKSGVTHVYLSPFIGGSACKALYESAVVPVAADILSRISWQLQSRTGVQVLLDVDTAKCPDVQGAQWLQISRELALLGHSNGLIVRSGLNNVSVVKQMLAAITATDPSALVGSTLDIPEQGFQLFSVDACLRTPPYAIFKKDRFQYEADASHCPARPVLEHFLRTGVRNFGTNQGVTYDPQKIAMDKTTLNSLLALGE